MSDLRRPGRRVAPEVDLHPSGRAAARRLSVRPASAAAESLALGDADLDDLWLCARRRSAAGRP
jgi:hypothetical protein